MYYLLMYDVVADYAAKRVPLRDAHLGMVREAHARGEIVMAGAHEDAKLEAIDGAVLVFKVDDAAVVQQFADADPYVRNGLVTRVRIRRWNVVVGA